jgi:hypothetical protein
MTFHRCFIPMFRSIDFAVSEEKIKIWTINRRQTIGDGQRTTDAKWSQKLTLPLARWDRNGSTQYGSVCHCYRSFFYWTLHKNRWGTQLWRKHVYFSNNQILSNDSPNYCHTRIFDLIPPRYYNDIAHVRFFPCCFFSFYLEYILAIPLFAVKLDLWCNSWRALVQYLNNVDHYLWQW